MNDCTIAKFFFPPLETLYHEVDAPTWTGEERRIISFNPNWPTVLSPQDQTVPSVFIAEQEPTPAEILAQSVNEPTCTGEERFSVVMVFCPKRPRLPQPHVQRVPSVLIAAVKLDPPDTCAQLVRAPTCTGEERFIMLLCPS